MNNSRLRVPAFVGTILFIVLTQAAAADINTAITATGPFGTLPVVALDGTETMSSLFRFDVDVATDARHPIAFEATLGNEVNVTVTRGQSTRVFSGMCSRISESSTGDGFTYRLELVPRLALLTLTENSRIFQDLSTSDILRKVLTEHGIDFQISLTRTYAARDYCVQYRESDFDFVSRLMEEEGIYYFFTHAPGGHKLVIADSSAAAPSLPAPANFLPAVQGSKSEGVFTWQKTQELRPAKVTLFDFNFQLPDNNLDATSPIQPSVVAGAVTHRLDLPATAGL